MYKLIGSNGIPSENPQASPGDDRVRDGELPHRKVRCMIILPNQPSNLASHRPLHRHRLLRQRFIILNFHVIPPHKCKRDSYCKCFDYWNSCGVLFEMLLGCFAILFRRFFAEFVEGALTFGSSAPFSRSPARIASKRLVPRRT